jgi:hypothetical protein
MANGDGLLVAGARAPSETRPAIVVRIGLSDEHVRVRRYSPLDASDSARITDRKTNASAIDVVPLLNHWR